MPVSITLACGDYDRTRALKEGRIAVEGVTLEYVPLEPEELFFRQLRFREFEASELSMGNYCMLQSRGANPFVALPVFPSRHFRHGFVWVRAASGITRPQDLRGKAVGIPEYHVTAAWWIRGFLEDDYGLRPSDVEWVVGGLNEPGRHARLDMTPPPGVTLRPLGEQDTLNDALLRGEIQALVAPRYPAAFAAGDPRVVRLFPNYVEEERAYFQRTGIFPIMHCIALRRDVYERHPWLAVTLTKAFIAAKEECQRALQAGSGTLPVMLPWLLGHVEEARHTLGTDFWPYGVEANRRVLETLLDLGWRQGLLARPLTVDELFAPNTLQLPPRS